MNNTTLFDFDLFGTISDEGNIQTYTNKDALTNSLKIWFCSREGDRLRSPTKGGLLDFQISKPMDDDRLSNLRERIRRALEKDFLDIFEIESLILNPIYNERLLEVNLTVNCKQLNSNFDLELKIRTQGI
jgi:hypothetical protein